MVISERIRFERIFCPVDLSQDSGEAIGYAASLARAYDGRLLIGYCDQPAQAEMTITPRKEYAGPMPHARREVEEAIHRLMGANGVGDVECENLILAGNPAVSIPREAAKRRVDLIVVRSRRRGHRAALLGSIIESICRTAPCPVLVTHPGQREQLSRMTGRLNLDHLLVAYDFSSDAEIALSYGLSFAHQYQAELHLLHVLPPRLKPEAPEVALLPLASEDAFHRAAQKLQSAVPSALRQQIRINEEVREGLPYREVLAYCEENETDLILMGASGTGFGMRALFGSNVDRVLRQSNCPVLIARPLRPANSKQSESDGD
jgi:nucleotide-binding universal stress UspA family protein